MEEKTIKLIQLQVFHPKTIRWQHVTRNFLRILLFFI